MKHLFILFIFFSTMACGQGIAIDGEVTKRLKITMADMSKYPADQVTTKDRDGKEHIFRGTLLVNLLVDAGVPLGKELRGEKLLKYLVIDAEDGYKVVFTLAETDPEFSASPLLLATHVDGNPLPASEGPFRLIAPQDKRPTRWVRQVSRIKILSSKE